MARRRSGSSLAINFTLTVPYLEYEETMPIDGTVGPDLYLFDPNRSAWLFTQNCLSAFLNRNATGNLTLSEIRRLTLRRRKGLTTLYATTGRGR